jgi:hypothetical protein
VRLGHRHRRHPEDASGGCSERGEDFYLAAREDIELATREDFFMAMDRGASTRNRVVPILDESLSHSLIPLVKVLVDAL